MNNGPVQALTHSLAIAQRAAMAPTRSAAPQTIAAKVTPAPAELEKLVADIQHKLATVSPELQFSVDQHSGQSIVTMTDKTTNEVLWQFPSNEAIQVRKALDLYQRGVLVNQKA